MKKILIFIFILFLHFNSFAQITIADYSGLDLTNTTAFLPSDESYYFEITNEGSSEINFIVKVTAFSIPGDGAPEDPTIAVCACGACTPITSAPIIIGTATTLAGGETYGEEGNPNFDIADVLYTSKESSEQATITIKVYEEGNESNFAEFTLDTQHVGIKSLSSDELISIYPNPATDFFTVKTSNKLYGSYLVFTNLLGKTVLKKSINNSELTVSTNQFTSGIYFYSLVNDGKIVETKKLIIK